MSKTTRPSKVILGWKYTDESPTSWRNGGEANLDYILDADNVTTGVQNILKSTAIPFDPAKPFVDVFIIPITQEGKEEPVTLAQWNVTTTVNDPSGITATETILIVNKPTLTTDFVVGDAVLIQTETFIITAISVGGGSTDTWTIRRAQHGTTGATHADSLTVRLQKFTVAHKELTTTGLQDTAKPPISSKILVKVLTSAKGGLGFTVTLWMPPTQANSIKGYEIQIRPTAVSTWNDDNANALNIRGQQATGTATVVHDSATFTTSTTLSTGYGGKLCFFYETVNLVTGEVDFPYALEISSAVDNGDGTWTATVTGGSGKLRTSNGTPKTQTFIIFDDWPETPDTTSGAEMDHWIVRTVGGGFSIPGDIENFFITERVQQVAACLVRARWLNALGTSPWIYWDGSTGTSTKGSASTVNLARIGAAMLSKNAQDFASTIIFSATDHDTIAWASGTITLDDGTAFSIVSGNTGTMPAFTYIYLDSDTSTTVLQTTTTATTSVGQNKILLCFGENTADSTQKAFFVPKIGTIGINETIIGPNSISTAKIQALAITASEIAANTITAGQISAGTITTTQLNATAIDGMTITGALLRTSSSGKRVEITSSDTINFYNTSGVKVWDVDINSNNLDIGTTQDGIINFNLIGSSARQINFNIGTAAPIPVVLSIKSTGLDMQTNNILDVGSITCTSLSAGTGLIDCGSLNLSEGDITDVGSIALDTIIADAGVTINLGATDDIVLFGTRVVLDLDSNNGIFKPRFLSQAGQPAAGTGATQITTNEMIIWHDTDDNKFRVMYNDGANIFKWLFDDSTPV